MTDIDELKSWIAHAEDDFGAAKTLLRRKRPFLYSLCFHAQQCAEKYMKALLVFKDLGFPKTHDLGTLDALSAFAVMSRYPGSEPTTEEAKESIAIAKSIRKFGRAFLGLEK